MSQIRTEEARALAERAFKDLLTVGRAWARHGLTVGRSALETSATTLHKTASLLDGLSNTLADKAEQPAEPTAEKPVAEQPAEHKPS